MFFFLILSFALPFGGLPSPARAGEVNISHNGLTLNANLEFAKGKSMADGLVLITHGTLAHNKMEFIAALQGLLKERGQSSLAINLSLGLDNRHGMYPCKETHTHKYTDALDEIGAWLQWLQGQGVKNVILAGHSRGGNQTAWFAAERDHPLISKVVLIAPGVWSKDKFAKSYAKTYNKMLGPVLETAQRLAETGKGSTEMKNVDFLYCSDTTVTASSFFSNYRDDERRDTVTVATRIKKPVLFGIGSDDSVNPGLKELVAPIADGKSIHYVEIEGAGHFFRDLYGEDLADAVAEFIGAEQ
ncbi:MAG: alpha/beta hydrolase [Rhodospirillales bacterium]|nr:alpha/beta hydrolase [Rhodospirillales bacterium]